MNEKKRRFYDRNKKGILIGSAMILGGVGISIALYGRKQHTKGFTKGADIGIYRTLKLVDTVLPDIRIYETLKCWVEANPIPFEQIMDKGL